MSHLARSASAHVLQAPSLRNSSLPHIFGGYALDLLFGDRQVSCLFDSLFSATSFRRFSEIYVNESQAGNASGAYFPPSFCSQRLEPYRVIFPRPTRYEEVSAEALCKMFHCICERRLMVRPDARWTQPERTYERLAEPWRDSAPKISIEKGYASFIFDEAKLPPRVPPEKAGDFIAVVDDPRFRRENAYFISGLGNKALLALVHFPHEPCPEDLVLVDWRHTMCIHDYYQEDECRREKWGYRLMKERLIEFALTRLRACGMLLPDHSSHAGRLLE